MPVVTHSPEPRDLKGHVMPDYHVSGGAKGDVATVVVECPLCQQQVEVEVTLVKGQPKHLKALVGCECHAEEETWESNVMDMALTWVESDAGMAALEQARNEALDAINDKWADPRIP